jgi:hypothetical protein
VATAPVAVVGELRAVDSVAAAHQQEAVPVAADAAVPPGVGGVIPAPQHAPQDVVTEPSRLEPTTLRRAVSEAGETVALRIGRAVQDGTRMLTMELHPAELGRVEVRLSFHDGGIGVQMTLDRPETYDAFARDRGVMERQLADAGINLMTGGLDLRFGQQPGHPAPQPGGAAARIALPTSATSPHVQPPSAAMYDGLINILA